LDEDKFGNSDIKTAEKSDASPFRSSVGFGNKSIIQIRNEDETVRVLKEYLQLER